MLTETHAMDVTTVARNVDNDFFIMACIICFVNDKRYRFTYGIYNYNVDLR